MLDGEGIVDTRTPFVPRDRETVEIWPSREGSADGEPERRSTVDSTTPLLVQDVVDSGPDRRATIDAPPVDPPQPPLTDAADDTAPPPPPDPVRPQLDWTAPTVEDGHQPPEHAFQQGWHPSDMLVGVDPASSLLEAIRQDLAPALGSSLDEAIGELSDQFGPSVLLARLTHRVRPRVESRHRGARRQDHRQSSARPRQRPHRLRIRGHREEVRDRPIHRVTILDRAHLWQFAANGRRRPGPDPGPARLSERAAHPHQPRCARKRTSVAAPTRASAT